MRVDGDGNVLTAEADELSRRIRLLQEIITEQVIQMHRCGRLLDKAMEVQEGFDERGELRHLLRSAKAEIGALKMD